MTRDDRPPRNWLWPAAKWALFLVVLAFVGRHASRLWGEFDSENLQLRWGWLALAAAVSILGWLPSLWFWNRLLVQLGARVPLAQVARAYYAGHPGKYVPGKATVILIRAALLSAAGVPSALTAFTATLETLTCMAAGVVTAVLLLPWIVAELPQLQALAEFAARPAWRIAFPVAALIGSLCGLALLSHLSTRLARRMAVALPAVGSLGQPVPLRTFAAGLGVFLAAWWLQGATLGLTLQGLSSQPVSWSDWPLWTGASAVSLVAGFLAFFAPGGLGVREGLLMELLRQQVGPHEAVAAAVTLRAVTLVGELITAGVLYTCIKSTVSIPAGDPRT
jgi:uncharacterized membrane protein YbhN (UPF0104 family)